MNPGGPFIICYDGSEAAERAIQVAPVLVGPGRPARVLYAYEPTSAVLGSVSRDVVNAYHRPVVLV